MILFNECKRLICEWIAKLFFSDNLFTCKLFSDIFLAIIQFTILMLNLNYFQTLGVDLQPKKCHIAGTQDIVELLIYDCGGLDLYVDCLSQFVSVNN